ncbi:MAG TPA: copper-binding protein [Candidatus Sulfotelmatobacter sp.]|jgi:protein SCO1/2|nr:copper-binding protein [Candidatus Sulfotelmatobacter sp.]
MKIRLFLTGLLLAVLAACTRESSAPVPPPQTAAAKTYDGHGVIQAISADLRSVTIKHEAISNYMGAMTMDFPVRDTNDLNGLAANDEIEFKLRVTDNDDWVENLRFVAHHIGEVTNNTVVFHGASAELKPGDPLPDFGFTDENGNTVSFSDFHGQAVAFTFFYTACPLPDYCPRMNKNFYETRKILLADTNAPANWQLLSISFDSDFDKPGNLSGYGNFYRGGDTNRWLFTVASTNTLAELAPKVDLHFWHDSGSITHNLRTVVLDTNRKIFRQFDGNDWTPEELAQAIADAARQK